MITVLTGTQSMPFKRMIDAIVHFVKVNGIGETINIQGGTYDDLITLPNINLFRYAPQETIDNYIKQSRFVVTHGGTGSIVGALGNGRKVIVMPRLRKYSEHNDDHQVELAELFESAGHIIYWRENELFSKVIEKAEKFNPTDYTSSFESLRDSIIKDIEKFINE